MQIGKKQKRKNEKKKKKKKKMKENGGKKETKRNKEEENMERGQAEKWCRNIQRALGIRSMSLDVPHHSLTQPRGLALIWHFAINEIKEKVQRKLDKRNRRGSREASSLLVSPVSGIVLVLLVLRVLVIVSVVLLHVVFLRMGAGRAHVRGAAILAMGGHILPVASRAVLLLAVVRAASVRIRVRGTGAGAAAALK